MGLLLVLLTKFPFLRCGVFPHLIQYPKETPVRGGLSLI